MVDEWLVSVPDPNSHAEVGSGALAYIQCTLFMGYADVYRFPE